MWYYAIIARAQNRFLQHVLLTPYAAKHLLRFRVGGLGNTLFFSFGFSFLKLEREGGGAFLHFWVAIPSCPPSRNERTLMQARENALGGPRPRTRPMSVSLPSATELQLPALRLALGLPHSRSGLLPLLPEAALHSSGGGVSPSFSIESPRLGGYMAPAGGASSPTAAVSSPRSALNPYVAGGLMQSMSTGRLQLLVPQDAPSKEVRKPAVEELPLETPRGVSCAQRLSLLREAAAFLAAPQAEWEERGWLCVEYTIRFTVHIVLLGMFESLFFWLFVSVSEDEALSKLVDGYVGSTLDSCPSWNATQRFIVTGLAELLFNRSLIDSAGAEAQRARGEFNGALYLNSWMYVAGLSGFLGLLAAWALVRRRKMPWGHIIAENFALITFLGLYELAFFKTIVLKYQAVSGAELVSCRLKVFGYCFSHWEKLFSYTLTAPPLPLLPLKGPKST